jgi:hypothetical protein
LSRRFCFSFLEVVRSFAIRCRSRRFAFSQLRRRAIRRRPLEARPCVHSCIGVDTAKGNRPSFSDAAPPEQAENLYERFCQALRELDVPVQTGVFGARMEVSIVNDGPVTIILE